MRKVLMNRGGDSGRGNSDRQMSYGSSSGGGGKSSNNDRISRSYRSPPLSARVSGSSTSRYSSSDGNIGGGDYEQHRSRRDEEPSMGSSSSNCLSKFYRERFGSHSPEDYLNLRLSQFDKSLSKDNIRSLIEREFKALTPFQIKIVNNPECDERLAYVNFDRPECAKIVRRNMVPRLQKVLGRRIVLDPAGVIRDQEGKFIPDRYNRAAMAAAVDRSRSPRSALSSSRRRASPTRGSGGGGGVNGNTNSAGRRRENNFTNLNQDDTQASRTIFVGNLPGDVRETELKRIFEIFGTIDNIDIKTLADSNAAFAFILYRTVEEAIDARGCQHNKPIRPGSTRCQIGYGKSQQSQRLYVGGLGAWASESLLADEFDRFGALDVVEYELGDNFAYVRYETMEAAIDACAQMKHFDITGKGNHITVDFAKDVRRRKRGHSASDDEDAKRRAGGPRTPSASPSRSPTEAGYIETLDELRDQVASTWKGIVTLKKTEYPLSFYRVFGKEHMVQDWLRDEAGNALRLNIIQRLPVDVDYYKRTIELTKSELALMIAIEGSQTVAPLVTYLKEKSAAGVVSIQGGMASVHVLAHSPIVDRLIKFFAPRIALLKPDSNYLLIALKKNVAASSVAGGVTQPQTAMAIATTRAQASPLPPPPPEPTHLPPPPPLPFLGPIVKREARDESPPARMPLREDRPAFQMHMKIKQEVAESASSLLPAPPPPIPPELSPPGRRAVEREPAPPPTPPTLARPAANESVGSSNSSNSSSSSEGENEHRRPPAQQHHYQQLNQRRHRRDNESEEEEEEDDDEEEEHEEKCEEQNREQGNGLRFNPADYDENQKVEEGDDDDDDDEGEASSVKRVTPSPPWSPRNERIVFPVTMEEIEEAEQAAEATNGNSIQGETASIMNTDVDDAEMEDEEGELSSDENTNESNT